MATFSTLQDKVKRRLIDEPASITSEVNDLINEAIREAEDRHNFRVMEAESPQTTTTARAMGTFPSDWKEKRARPFLRLGQDGLVGTKAIYWAVSKEDMLKRFELDDTEDDGEPQFILLETGGAALHVYPFSDSASDWDDGEYRLVMPYWKYLADLSANSDTNWITDNGADYIINQATGNGFMLLQDEARASAWFLLAEKKFRTLKRLDKLSRIERDISIVPRLDAGGVTPRRN